MDPMPAAAADWIRDVVLPSADRAGPTLRMCRCQYGACGACVAGRHDACTDDRIVGPDAYMLGRKSAVRVWRSGTPCRSQCLCDCRKPAAAELEPDLGQLALFALAAP